MDDNAVANTYRFIAEQREATGTVPTDQTILIERTQDEVGDWNIILESPLGLGVHAPWALAVGSRLRERFGQEANAQASNDGIIIRFPQAEGDIPGAELFLFEPDEIVALVTREVSGSAAFAARFRECAARALLLGSAKPGKRSPLWLQRQKSARLLEVAADFADFPIILEAARECLQDLYDLQALTQVTSDLRSGAVTMREVTTSSPSPWAQSLLFGYVGEYLYQGDVPLAERRLAALAMDADLMAQLLGKTEYRDVLVSEAVKTVEKQLQRLAPGYQARGAEGVVDLLRTLGPLTLQEITERTTSDFDIEALARQDRVFFADGFVIAAEDAGLIHAVLATEVPETLRLTFPASRRPLQDFLSRYARTHGPFSVTEIEDRFAIGWASAQPTSEELEAKGTIVKGRFDESGELQWTDAEVLWLLKRASAAKLRSEIDPVSQSSYAAFLLKWAYIGSLHGEEGLLSAIEQLAGLPLAASTIEAMIFPARVDDFDPAQLDALVNSGQVVWVGEGKVGTEGHISFHLRDSVGLTLRSQSDVTQLDELQRRIFDHLQAHGAQFGSDLASLGSSAGEVAEAL